MEGFLFILFLVVYKLYKLAIILLYKLLLSIPITSIFNIIRVRLNFQLRQTFLHRQYIAQYYAATPANKAKIIALAALLGCEYRTVENIIALQVTDDETLARLKRCECLPCAVEAGVG